MQIDLVSVVAACALIIPTAALIVVSFVAGRMSKEVKRLRSCNVTISELLAQEKQAYEQAGGAFMDTVEVIHKRHEEELKAAEVRYRDLASKLYELHDKPLKDIPDDELGLVVRRELTERVKAVRQLTLPFGKEAHKLATHVGGQCFRVVDHVKRGHGEFAVYGPYDAPLVVNPAMAEA